MAVCSFVMFGVFLHLSPVGARLFVLFICPRLVMLLVGIEQPGGKSKALERNFNRATEDLRQFMGDLKVSMMSE